MKAIQALTSMRSLSYCIDKAIEKGYTANFFVNDTLLQHVDSGQSYQPGQVHIVDYYRFEGQSDPDDNSILYIIETNDGRRGTIADAYGMYASTAVANFFNEVEDIKKKEHKS
jgi:hypothetical protein